MEDGGVLENIMKRYTAALILFLTIGIPAISDAVFLGPYSGTVMDSQTGEPIEGASVLVYWTKELPGFLGEGSHTVPISSALVYTDKAGRYNIPRALYNLGLTAVFASTNVIIYQPGYKVYIQTIWRDNPYQNPDPSYKDKDNIAKLDRIPPDFSYRKHYEKIEEALRWIDDDSHYYILDGTQMTWEKLLDIYRKILPQREELLRRAEWEKSRGVSEERSDK